MAEAQGITSFGDLNKVYVSIPDTSQTCDNLGLPSLPPTWSYRCRPLADYKKIDSNGWVPVNFASIIGGSPLSILPIDPINSTSSGLYYTYVPGGSWKLTAMMESEKQAKAMAKDGGPDVGIYEIGTNLNLANFQRGLAGYWKLDELSGTLADSSGNGNNGAQSGGVTYGAAGKVDKALSFDGVDDYVNSGDFTSLTGAITVSAWIYATQAPTSQGRTAVSTYRYNSGGCTQRGWNFGADWTGTYFQFRVQQSTGVCSASASDGSYFANELNEWHHMVGVFSPNNSIKLYKDGVLIVNNSTTLSGIDYQAGDILRIGRRSAESQSYFAGLIDEVRIYNRALSAAEISAIYNATK